MTKFRGPAFPSYFNQSTPKPRMQWKAHCGKRAQLRNLRQRCRPILESEDALVVEQRERLRTMVAGEPFPEFGLLHLTFAAIDACDQTGEPWHVCMKYMLDKFEDMEADRATATA